LKPETAQREQRGEARCLTSLLFVETAAALAFLAAAVFAVADWRIMPQARYEPRSGRRQLGVTAIVPARNEEANIAEWIHDICRLRHRPQWIIVADDCSEDATAKIAREAAAEDTSVEVVSFGQPPAGWVGKNWAAYNAAALAQTEWLFFSDADVRMAPQALAAALALAIEQEADALSLSATLMCEGWLERHVMPVIAALIFSGHPVCLINDDRASTGLLAGGFMLVRREAYERIGGHRAVRGSIAEDRDLALRLKAFGYRIRLADGAQLVRVRMYRSSREMWEGWRKNFYEGARRQVWLAALFIGACLCMLVLPLPALAVLGVTRLRRRLSRGERRLAIACGTCAAATALVRAVRDRAIGFRTDILSVAATPVGGAFAAAVMVASAWRGHRGQGQIWKGRVIRYRA
jgi:cellulose synthase/poly-beta-1,6-N-acetylglucosamine synthase-like glycosyltransferase